MQLVYSYAKEILKNAKGDSSGNGEALSVIEAVFGEGYVEQYDFADSAAYERQNGRGKGTDSRNAADGASIKAWRFDEQEQQRTDTLTDREVLEMAANEVKVSDLTQAEKDALTIFQDRLSKLKDLQDKRVEAGKLY